MRPRRHRPRGGSTSRAAPTRQRGRTGRCRGRPVPGTSARRTGSPLPCSSSVSPAVSPIPAFSASNYSSNMRVEDMVLVSVDDHLVEPPGLFDGRLPARFRDDAPKVVSRDDGSDVWVFNGTIIPNIGLNAVSGRPKEEYG